MNSDKPLVLADGHYRAVCDEYSVIVYVKDMLIGDDKVEWWVEEEEVEFYPVVVTEKAEYDAMQATLTTALARITELEAELVLARTQLAGAESVGEVFYELMFGEDSDE